MNRNDFINLLFDDGAGLTLDQINIIEDGLIDTVPDGLIENLQENNGMTLNDARDVAICQARDVFIDALQMNTDMLMLKHFIEEAWSIKLTDKQVYIMFHVVRYER